MYELKSSCGSTYNGETKKKIISRPIEHQQESIKGNWSSFGATESTQECCGRFEWLRPQNLSIKNRCYKIENKEELLEIDMVETRFGKYKVLSRDNENFFKTNA